MEDNCAAVKFKLKEESDQKLVDGTQKEDYEENVALGESEDFENVSGNDSHRRRHCTSFRLLLRRQMWVNTVRMAANIRKLFKNHRLSAGNRRKKTDRIAVGDEIPKTSPYVSSPRLFPQKIEGAEDKVGPSEPVIREENVASSPQMSRGQSCSPSESPIKSSLHVTLFKKNNDPPLGLPPSETNLKHMKTVRSRRLLREFHELSKSQFGIKDPIFTVDLVHDCLYEWKVKLLRIDPESELSRDMVEFNIPYILLNLSFPESFPFQPPFLRVLAPKLEKGFVMEGGAICMELLTPRGWASAYTIEAVIMQFAASLVKGQGRISRKHKNPKDFSKRSAEASFRSLVKTHDKYGWVTPPLAEG